MKWLRSLGHGVVARQAENVTTEEEEKLWQEGLPGDHSPQTLLDTILFLCGGVDEQIIMHRTGHRSIDGVRKYKRISNEQEKATSCIITNSHSSSNITSLGAPQSTFNNCSSFTIKINLIYCYCCNSDLF